MITNSQLHHVLIKKIIEDGYAPSNPSLAEHFDTSEAEVIRALYQLQAYHGVVLHPNEPKVWVIHPFSLSPTNFYIKSEKGQWWGNCAWCSLGVAALVKTDLSISTTVGAEGRPITIHLKDGEIVEKDLFIHFPVPMSKAWDNVIYTCSNMLVFERPEQVRSWSTRHNIPLGDIQPIQNIWDFSRKWYGDHLNPDWVKWSAADAKSMFMEFNLTHPTWDLETSGQRF